MNGNYIGTSLFTDGVDGTVHINADGRQHVHDDEGVKVYGAWILTEEVLADAPVVVDGCKNR